EARKENEVAALEGESRARKVLARWSGWRDDADKAAETLASLEKAKKKRPNKIERTPPKIAKHEDDAQSTSDLLLQIVKNMRFDDPSPSISVDKESDEVEPVVEKRSTHEAALLRIQSVVIDAGHGGKDFGATGVKGVREKDVNLQIAL